MNLRVLKKDIDFLLNDFISDCLIFSDFHAQKKDEEVKGLISDALILSNSLAQRVNHPVKVAENGKSVKLEGKEVKAYYKAIKMDLYKGFDELFQKLSALAK